MITKTEAMTKATAEEDAAVQMWEAKIDAALRTHDGSTWLSFTGTRRVRDRIMKAYEMAGWTVAYHDDQRDGASLTFT